MDTSKIKSVGTHGVPEVAAENASEAAVKVTTMKAVVIHEFGGLMN